MRIHRCRICGETFLGSEAPSQCPFCGAHRELLGAPEDYSPAINDIEPTDQERADLAAAIELERSNTRFYLGMSQRKDNDTLRSAYKRLSRIESEHCSLFCKLAGVSKPDDLTEPAETTGTWAGDIAESRRREQNASATYAQLASRAVTPRLLEVWTAVSDVERDHIEFDGYAERYV